MANATRVKCLDCDTMFNPRPSGRGVPRLRCTIHRRERKRDMVRAREILSRARGYGVVTELVIPGEVFERDNWVCYLCGGVIPRRLRDRKHIAGYSEPLAPTVDHVVPLARGGSHTMKNCKTAHRDCNSRKHTGTAGQISKPRVAAAPKPFNLDVIRQRLDAGTVRQIVSDRGRALYGLTDDCLIWVGSKPNRRGYATATFGGRFGSVHRIAYEAANGDASARGLTIDHLCGVPLCVNANHLEAVTAEENLRRAALVIVSCPAGHAYDENNTHIGLDGHRFCRQCNRNRYHAMTLGHDFVADPENRSTKRERCLVCRVEKESSPQFCPAGHEYTVANTGVDRGKRYCVQCRRDRFHVPQFGHSFVVDPDNPSDKRERCLACVQAAAPVTHCKHGHEFTDLTSEITKKGQRNCVQCRLNSSHVPKYGHEFVIDPNHTGKLRQCLVCVENAPVVTHCVNGHEFTPENTKIHKTRGNRICITCQTNGFHVPQFGHEFVVDPDHKGKLRRCLRCRHDN